MASPLPRNALQLIAFSPSFSIILKCCRIFFLKKGGGKAEGERRIQKRRRDRYLAEAEGDSGGVGVCGGGHPEKEVHLFPRSTPWFSLINRIKDIHKEIQLHHSSLSAFSAVPSDKT